MFSDRKIFHRYIYVFALTFLGVMLPWSEFFMSAVQFLLLGNWILEGGFKKKLQILKERKSIIAFIGIILIHFIWLFNTNDIKYALHDIQIKIPLLILPLIIGTTTLLSRKEFHIILKLFVLSVFFASLFSVAIYLGYTKFEYTGYRDLSVFISHIRFSLMIVMAIVIAFYLLKFLDLKYKILSVFIAFWLIIFLFFLQSFTGIIVFGFISFVAIIYLILKIKHLSFKYTLIVFLIALTTGLYIWIQNGINEFNLSKNIDINELEKRTINNNRYLNDTIQTIKENGNLVSIYICNKELKKEWNKKSDIAFDSLDNRGNSLRFTMYRYLASKGLRKDSVGISKLTNNDIVNIENGMPNYLFENKLSPYTLLYKLLWEYNAINENQDINNKSLLQRIEYFKAGKAIFFNNFLIGVGTGDVQTEFDNYYQENNSPLNDKNRHRAHNQILTFLITFGIIGFAIVIFGFSYPLFFEQNKEKLLLSFFLIIVFLSFLDEDTLETQPGVTFFTYFYVLLVFGYKKLVSNKQ